MLRTSGLFVFALGIALVAAGCSKKSPAAEVTVVSVGVTPAAPSIAAGTKQQFKATAVRSDGTSMDVTAQAQWSSSDESVASVDAPGAITSHQPGNAAIRATYQGTTGETALTVTGAVVTELQVTSPNGALARGTMAQLTATALLSDGRTQDVTSSVTWSSSTPGVVSLSTEVAGLATAAELGSAVITATDAATGVSATLTLYVTAATLKQVEITPNNASIALGTEQQFQATGTFSDGSKQNLTSQVTWAVSDAAVASISNLGLARGTAAGSAVISAVFGNSSAAANLTVTSATLESITVTANSPSLPRGTTENVTATGTYSDGTTQDITSQVTWTSSDAAVADVSNAMGSEGRVTALAPGKVVLTAQDSASGVTGSLALSITQAELVSLAVSPDAPSSALGTQQQFTVTGTYSDNSTLDLTSAVTWSSSDAAVATVSNGAGSKGLASTLSPGTSTITATDPVSGLTGSTTQTVTNAVLTSLDISPLNASIVVNTAQQYAAIGTFSDGTTQDVTTTATWASSDATIAAVSNTAGSNGEAQGMSTGTATITATLDGITSNAATLTVTPRALVSITVSPGGVTVVSGAPQQFIATGNYNDGTTDDLTTSVTWLSADPSVLIVSNVAGSQGLGTAIATGTATVFATLNNLSGSVQVTTFVAPAVCVANTDPDTGAAYVVCAADANTAWLSSTGMGGQYHYEYICQLQGYTGANLYGGNCGSVCGFCQQSTCASPGSRTFDGSGANCGSDAHGVILCQTVMWQCYR